MSIQRFEPRTASANAEDEHHEADRDAVDDPPVAPVQARRDRDRDDQADAAERGGDRLARDEVARIAGHVEARDARDRPQPVGDERPGREQQHEIEPPHQRGEVHRVAAERNSLASGVDDHQSVLTRVWLPPLTPKNFSKTRSAAGAAAVDPWPPFSITAQTTMRGASVWAGPQPHHQD